jgi:hypothetical protein
MDYSRECSINRYYDPTTDQFLSVDPDVAQTDQPYVFTNDNPLNATDPLGMEALKSVVIQEDAVAKRCKDNPKANGCRGIDVVGDVLKHAGDIATVVAVGVCIASTVGVCAVAAGAALALRVTQRHEDGTPILSASNGIDALTTAATFGLLSIPAGLGAKALEDSPLLLKAFKLYTALPDIYGWGIGHAARRDIP